MVDVSKYRYLISRNKLEQVISSLLVIGEETNKEIHNSAILLSNRYVDYVERKNLGILNEQEIERNKIVFSLLRLLDEIEKEMAPLEISKSTSLDLSNQIQITKKEEKIESALKFTFWGVTITSTSVLLLFSGFTVGLLLGVFLVGLIVILDD